ncbi:hypothetical protein WJX84_006899 [Apatococcus fuscideae]|uniref:Symplekin/Pta1 N-terminal domain-containing protein n=1 Tax=Apatococcus fuscideae TaxID=2026836 RepID=A0AAW1TFV7_9CHLO
MKQENENNISQHNFAVELLNDTKLATDGPAKVERLKQLQEVLLFGAPTLIKEFVPELSLHMNPIPKQHPFLSASQIIQEGFMDFGSILGFIKPSQMQDPKGSTIIVAMKAVALISQRRPRLLGRGLPALLNIPSHNPGSASVQSNLKVCLLSMLKNTDADAVPWRKRIADTLTRMGEGEAAKKELRTHDRAAKKEKASSSIDQQPVAKRLKPDPEGAAKCMYNLVFLFTPSVSLNDHN